jgi:hypothetical protein
MPDQGCRIDNQDTYQGIKVLWLQTDKYRSQEIYPDEDAEELTDTNLVISTGTPEMYRTDNGKNNQKGEGGYLSRVEDAEVERKLEVHQQGEMVNGPCEVFLIDHPTRAQPIRCDDA